MEADYSAFNYVFTQNQSTAKQLAQTTGGAYATELFDAPVVGGASNQLDPNNLSLGGDALINVTPFLGSASQGLVPATSANIIGLSTTIAAHELGHLSGLQHQDAISPVGNGIYGGIDPEAFYPALPGVTTTTVTSSPSSNGTETFTATVTSDVQTTTAPTGTVDFIDKTTGVVENSITLGNATANAITTAGVTATATIAVANGDTLIATYSGDSNFAGSSSSATAGANTTTTVLTSNPTVYGENVVFTATVSSDTTGAGTPTGAVKFSDTKGAILSTVPLVNGVATSSAISASSLVGDSVVATYLGASNLATSSGSQNIGVGDSSSGLATPFDIMASPDAVGSTLLDAAGQTYVGERDAVALAFNDTGVVYQQANLAPAPTPPSSVIAIPSPKEIGNGILPTLAVPNTLPTGVTGHGLDFNVTAAAVDGTLTSQNAYLGDFYAFQGQAGQTMNFQVISRNNTLNTNPILIPELVLVGPQGQIVSFNVHEFESSDSHDARCYPAIERLVLRRRVFRAC